MIVDTPQSASKRRRIVIVLLIGNTFKLLCSVYFKLSVWGVTNCWYVMGVTIQESIIIIQLKTDVIIRSYLNKARIEILCFIGL